MSQSPFQKFVPKKKNSVIKEEFRQEKKKARKEKNAYFDKLKEEKYQARMTLKRGIPNPAATPKTEKIVSPATSDKERIPKNKKPLPALAGAECP